MAMIGNFEATQVAQYVDYTGKVLEMALECGYDTWKVIKLSARTAALVTGHGLNLVPAWETVLAKKDFDRDPEFFVARPKARMLRELRKGVKVGIYDNCEYIARIYKGKIVVTVPYVKWIGNSGSYAERKERISDIQTVREVQACGYGQTERAWGIIGQSLNDPYLSHAGE